ncbi:rod-determining factor RdfA [Candidatus Halobonum tyrrellensis]|uniref:Uncharacterized protein n=1 Tax=Candidatus Halobonum tyrrellensis G22 TaxID=1324957 RepID=V4HGM3_9EURY|nr:rod-determining factor RdfA [Candidatus Halobonum tyrrellensis]ESP86954.1 hypothetical protein K933_16877 [Candidatus Halobonum tyrrellensis G22]
MAESNSSGDSQSSRRRSKVERVIDEYDLGEAGDTLVRRWTSEGDDRMSLRALADWFNTRVLEAALERNGETPLEGEVDNLYRLLTDDDASAGSRTQAERTLERDGVDPEELRSDFLTHQTIYTYLTKRRNVSREDTETDPIEAAERRVQGLLGRTQAVAEESLGRLAGDQIRVGDAEVYADVSVYCSDCEQTFEFVDLLERGGCDCA